MTLEQSTETMNTTKQGSNGQLVKEGGLVDAEWHLLDAKERVLGRLATELAGLVMGKHRLDYAAHRVAPVTVVVLNTDDVVLTGRKEEQKVYYRHSGYPGGLKQRTIAEQRARDSRRIVYDAVSGMLPKNNLRSERLGRLKLYVGNEHPHEAQLGSVN